MRPRYAAPSVHPDFPPFQQRPPWLGPHLQTMRNSFLPPRPKLNGCSSERLILPLADGSGDRLAALLQRPAGGARRPLVVVIHGLSGTEDSAYMLASAATLLAAGHTVLRLNLRGSGPSRPLCRLQYHAGRTGDLRDALSALDADVVGAGYFVVGYSLGGNMLLKFLAENGSRSPILAAATVSAPLDLAAASQRIREPRNRFYQNYLLRGMKDESCGNDALLSDAERRSIIAARSVLEFDDQFVAPRNGYAGAEEYYAENSAGRFLAAVEVPTLVIHALDDPWIPAAAYERAGWSANPHLTPLLSPTGGHVGFHGRGSSIPWHDRCVAQWFGQCSASKGSQRSAISSQLGQNGPVHGLAGG